MKIFVALKEEVGEIKWQETSSMLKHCEQMSWNIRNFSACYMSEVSACSSNKGFHYSSYRILGNSATF